MVESVKFIEEFKVIRSSFGDRGVVRVERQLSRQRRGEESKVQDRQNEAWSQQLIS